MVGPNAQERRAAGNWPETALNRLRVYSERLLVVPVINLRELDQEGSTQEVSRTLNAFTRARTHIVGRRNLPEDRVVFEATSYIPPDKAAHHDTYAFSATTNLFNRNLTEQGYHFTYASNLSEGILAERVLSSLVSTEKELREENFETILHVVIVDRDELANLGVLETSRPGSIFYLQGFSPEGQPLWTTIDGAHKATS